MKDGLQKIKKIKKEKRHRRVRAKVFGVQDKPRMCVFKSLKHIYIQLINDENGKTLLSVSDYSLKDKVKKTRKEISKELGQLIAKKALESKIDKIVFDRSGYKYHGIVKNLAEGAREGGLKF